MKRSRDGIGRARSGFFLTRLAGLWMLLSATALPGSARAQGNQVPCWSTDDLRALLEGAVDAAAGWGQAMDHVSEVYRELSGKQAFDRADNMLVFSGQLETLVTMHASLVSTELLCAAITDPQMRRWALLMLSSNYEHMQMLCDNMEKVCAADTDYEESRQMQGEVLQVTRQYDQAVVLPRIAELNRLKVNLHVDPNIDGAGPLGSPAK